MIEKCNFKSQVGDEVPNCLLTTLRMKCPGEMNCILYTLYYYEEES